MNLGRRASSTPPPRTRADVLLVERGLFDSRARAQAAIEAGLVRANDKQVMKPSETIPADAVLQAQLSAIAAVREGATAHRVDRAAREALRSKGLEKEFVHSTGHGLGLEIHEAPRLGKKDKTRLLEGMVVTIEPGVYVKGLGGVRIEDTVLVTKNGCEVLTPTSKELMVL